MQLQTVSIDLFSDPHPLFCPACGQQVYAAGGFQKACPHLIFRAKGLPKSWTWYHPQAEKRFLENLQCNYRLWQGAASSSFENYLANRHIDSIIQAAADSYQERSAFLLAVTTSDRGCGGMCQGTIYLLFDFRGGGH